MDRESDLERQAAAGSSDAQFALGARALAGNRPEDFRKGVELIEAAASNRHGEALAMLATLEAIGAGRRRDWGRALRQLEAAADCGSADASAQLRLLAGGNEDDGRRPSERIDMARLLRAPDRIALSETPRMRVFEGFATPAECHWLIDRLGPRLGPAMVWDEGSGRGKVDPSRTSSAVELRLPEMDVAAAVLRARIAEATMLPETIFEVPQVMRYSVGQEFVPHHDFLDPEQPGPASDIARRGQRIGTFLIYLNDDYEGGQTEFPKAGLSFRGRTGDALFFTNVTRDGRADPLTLHAGRPPTRGEKWVFSQWIRDRPPG
jgi:hypothetical protein